MKRHIGSNVGLRLTRDAGLFEDPVLQGNRLVICRGLVLFWPAWLPKAIAQQPNIPTTGEK